MSEIERGISTSEKNTAFFQKLNKNTAYLDNNSRDINVLMHYAPDKIRNRFKINLFGLNQMTTVIVPPSQQSNLGQDFFNSVISFSDLVNDEIGLPKTNNLVIRTARAKNFYNSGNDSSRNKFSEPMVIASNVGSKKQNLLLKIEGEKTQKLNSLAELSDILPYDKYLLIHDDNEVLQKKAVHGTFIITDHVSELVIRTNSLHARNITSKEFPNIKFTAINPDDLFKINPHTISGLIQNDVLTAHSPHINIEGYTLTDREAKYITKEAQNFSVEIIEKYNKIVELFGKNAVMEFRLYPPVDSMSEYNRLQILDVNDKFT